MKFLAALFLFIVCFLTYSNSLGNPFLMDDYALIVENRAIKDVDFLQILPSPNSNAIYAFAPRVYFRPITHLLNLVAFLMFGDDPFGYHMFNLFFFYAAGVALYELLHSLFGSWRISLLTAVLFCAHPINGVLVNYITMTSYPFLVMAVILAIRCFLLAEGQKKRPWMYGASGVWFFAALLCHEIAVAFPLYLAAVLFFVKEYSLRRTAKAITPFIFVFLLYAVWRAQYVSLKMGSPLAPFSMSFLSYGATLGNLVLHYMLNLVSFRNIVLIWASPILKTNLLLWNFVFGAAILGLIFLGLYRKRKEKSLAIAWFLIGLLPLSAACVSRLNLGVIIEPHWMLFSSIGFVLYTAFGLTDIYLRLNKHLGVVLMCLLAAVYMLTSRQYNKLWSDEKGYCRYMLSLSPQMELPVWWLASNHLRERDYAPARELFKKTLRGVFGDWEAYLNLGLIESVLGNTASGSGYYRRALEINPYAAEAYNNLGANLINAGKLEEAEKYLKRAVSLDRHFINPKKNLAIIYMEQGKIDEAATLLGEVLKTSPQDAYSLKTLERIRKEKEGAR